MSVTVSVLHDVSSLYRKFLVSMQNLLLESDADRPLTSEREDPDISFIGRDKKKVLASRSQRLLLASTSAWKTEFCADSVRFNV